MLPQGCCGLLALGRNTRFAGPLLRTTPLQTYQVLNEMIIDRGSSSFLTNIECYEKGRFISRVQADGVMLATPTGAVGAAGGRTAAKRPRTACGQRPAAAQYPACCRTLCAYATCCSKHPSTKRTRHHT